MLGGQVPHFRPVKSTLLFMQKYRDIKDLLWGRKCIFGRATDHWQRIEFQNMHLLLWVDDGVADRLGKVVATVPRSSDEKALRAKVLKYQVHNCKGDGLNSGPWDQGPRTRDRPRTWGPDTL